MENFVPENGSYNIKASQKGALEEQLRNQLVINGNSKKGVVHKTMIDGQEHFMKNGGNTDKPVWYLKPKSKVQEQIVRREDAMTYGDHTSKVKRKNRKFKGKPNADPKFANEAYMLNVPTYEEHSTAAQSGIKLPEGIGTDDIENVSLRVDKEFDVHNVKAAKDDFEDFAKRNGNPWHAFHNEKTDELQIVNMEEWRQKGDGEFVDIFEDGVTLNKYEVTSWKNALKTGKLGNFPIRKAAYLLKEINKNPGMKLLKGTALVGIPALLDVVEAKDGFTELANEELTAREKALAGLKAYAATAGIATLTPAAPVAGPTSIATGLLYSGIEMMDAQKIKKRNDLMLSLGIEQLPNGELLDSAKNVVQYDYEKGEIITPQLGQGPVKKLTRRGYR